MSGTRPRRDEVARRAGVSKTTVTYVLNDTPGIKIGDATRRKVLQAAAELGYEPSFSATCMKRGRTELVGLLVPDHQARFTPFYHRMISGVMAAAGDSDYHFLYLSQDRVAKYQRCLARDYLDGVIVLQSAPDPSHLQRLHDHGLPTVSLNYEHPLPLPMVSVDYEGAMQQAVEHLLATGARDLLFIHGSWPSQPITRYCQAYEALATDRSRTARFSTESLEWYGLPAARITELIDRPWDGLIVDGYEIAREIHRHLALHATATARRMVVFSETPDIAPIGDALILEAPAEAAGQAGWAAMQRLLDGAPATATTTRIPFQPLPQESTP